MSEKIIRLKVVTPIRTLYEGNVKRVLIRTRGENGEFAVYPDHIPMTSDIGLGTFEFTEENGEEKTASLFGGYTVIFNNTMVIMAQTAEWPWEIDAERAKRAKERAEQDLKEMHGNYAVAEAALYRAVTRLKLFEIR